MNQMLKLSVKNVEVTIIHNTSIMNDKFSEKKRKVIKKNSNCNTEKHNRN